MSPRLDDIERLIALIDRVVFAEPAEREGAIGPEPQSATLALLSYLNETFPRVALPAGRRARIQRRLMRDLGIPAAPLKHSHGTSRAAHVGRGPGLAPWGRLEDEMNRRLRAIDPRWRPVMGGAAIVLLGVLGIAYWRGRSGERGIAAFAR
jgi:hypothetical protein